MAYYNHLFIAKVDNQPQLFVHGLNREGTTEVLETRKNMQENKFYNKNLK